MASAPYLLSKRLDPVFAIFIGMSAAYTTRRCVIYVPEIRKFSPMSTNCSQTKN